ncbi:MAG: TM1266 family iron-only hydrogenase system putative regulator [Bacteroidales bacterium]|jgi:putative iron-only hydrogenase system regulator|nr:CopG family transcriptional regulator [Bacteroidales bacterium]
MEKRLGIISILISNADIVKKVNDLLSEYSHLILARQGLLIRNYNLNFISLIIEGTTDEISALTGKLGRLENVEVKSVLSKIKL